MDNTHTDSYHEQATRCNVCGEWRETWHLCKTCGGGPVLVDVKVLELYQRGEITSTGVLVYLTCCRNRAMGIVAGPTDIGRALGVGAATVNRQIKALREHRLLSEFSPRVVP